MGLGEQILEGNPFCEGPDLFPCLSFLLDDFYSLLFLLLHLTEITLSKSHQLLWLIKHLILQVPFGPMSKIILKNFLVWKLSRYHPPVPSTLISSAPPPLIGGVFYSKAQT